MSDLYIGLMSGTSMDGIDAVLVRFHGERPELLASHGYAGLRIDEVAASSGVAKTTIYRRWPGLAHLVVAAMGVRKAMDTRKTQFAGGAAYWFRWWRVDRKPISKRHEEALQEKAEELISEARSRGQTQGQLQDNIHMCSKLDSPDGVSYQGWWENY